MSAKTDRELLELAARAAGIALEWDSDGPCYYSQWRGLPQKEPWNPLADDGDALRLAVKLRLELVYSKWNVSAIQPYKDVSAGEDFGDPYTATRRAIVRAAAAIGETL